MGFFSNTPASLAVNNTPGGLATGAALKYFADGFNASPGKFLADKFLPDIYQELYQNAVVNLSYDGCNLVYTSQINGMSVQTRNPFCSPGIKPIPDPPPLERKQYFVPPNGCDQIVTFAFINHLGILNGGGGAFNNLVDGGKTAFPIGGSVFGYNPNIYLPSIAIFEHDASNTFTNQISRWVLYYLNGENYELLATSILFRNTDLIASNGVVAPNFPLYNSEQGYTDAPWAITSIYTGACVPTPPPIQPPPPPPPKDCCMCCCNDNGNENKGNNDQLLKLILKRIGALPATVPDHFAKTTSTPITIESLAELMLWQAKQLDGVSGKYPIPITIKADPSDPKSKDQDISLPNQAETLAEILGLLITTKRDSHAGLIATIKCLGEAGMIKNLCTQIFDVVHANAEFLGYKLEQVKRTIPSLFTPGGKNLAETMQEKNVDIISYENKDTTDLQDDLKKILTMCSRWNAQNWRALGTDAAKSLAQNLTGNVKTVTDVHNALKKDTFKNFLTEVEQGFTSETGIKDSKDPWGQPVSQAPTIKQLGVVDEVVAPFDDEQQKASDSKATQQANESAVRSAAVKEIGGILKAL